MTPSLRGSSILELTRQRLARRREALKIPGKMTREWLRSIASKGGSVKGPTKKRGDAEYYRKLREKGLKKLIISDALKSARGEPSLKK